MSRNASRSWKQTIHTIQLLPSAVGFPNYSNTQSSHHCFRLSLLFVLNFKILIICRCDTRGRGSGVSVQVTAGANRGIQSLGSRVSCIDVSARNPDHPEKAVLLNH